MVLPKPLKLKRSAHDSLDTSTTPLLSQVSHAILHITANTRNCVQETSCVTATPFAYTQTPASVLCTSCVIETHFWVHATLLSKQQHSEASTATVPQQQLVATGVSCVTAASAACNSCVTACLAAVLLHEILTFALAYPVLEKCSCTMANALCYVSSCVLL